MDKANPGEKTKALSSGGNPKKRSRLEAVRSATSNLPPPSPRTNAPAPREAIQAIQQIASNHMSNAQNQHPGPPQNSENNQHVAKDVDIEEKLLELEQDADDQVL